MYKIIYYNLNTKRYELTYNDEELALLQYSFLIKRYQYCAVTYNDKIIIGKLLENF